MGPCVAEVTADSKIKKKQQHLMYSVLSKTYTGDGSLKYQIITGNAICYYNYHHCMFII